MQADTAFSEILHSSHPWDPTKTFTVEILLIRQGREGAGFNYSLTLLTHALVQKQKPIQKPPQKATQT